MVGEWPDVPKREPGKPRRKIIKPQLKLTNHELITKGKARVCVKCGKRAASKRMMKKLWESECQPPPWRSTGTRRTGASGSLETCVAVGMAAMVAAGACSEQRAEDERPAVREHRVEVHGPYVVCVLCGARSATRRAGLGVSYPGPLEKKGKSTKDDAKRKKRDRILAGKHPQTGKQLPQAPVLPVRRG